MFDAVLNIESVCRLCLSSNGVMSRIHELSAENQPHYTLTDKIHILASVQISPDDGLPSLICDTCRNKVEQYMEFKLQIENSYNILCQCINVASSGGNTNEGKHVTDETIDNYAIVQQQQPTPPEIITRDNKKNKPKKSNEMNISSLFKDHLVSGISENEILVNQDFNFPNSNNVSYVNITDDMITDNYLSIALPEDAITVDENGCSILSKDISVITHLESNEDTNMSFIKPNDAGKMYNISFIDGNNDNLPDIFLGLENEEGTAESCQDSYEDISKYLKNSHGLDIKKLKDDYKNQRDAPVDIDREAIKKKLLSNGVSLIKTALESNKIMSAGIAAVKNESIDANAAKVEEKKTVEKVENKVIKVEENSEDISEEDFNKFPDMIFAKMSILEKDKYVDNDAECEEIFPRIVKINCLDSNSPETKFKFTTYLCQLCLMEFRECYMSTLKMHSENHFSCKEIQGNIQNKPTYTCEGCIERFTTRYTFIKHQRQELNVKIFTCDICNKKFSSEEKLQNHSRVHGEKTNKFTCLFCNESFEKKYMLQQHETKHIRDGPLICPHCDKNCKTVTSLKYHIKRHTEGLKYCCEICGKGFYALSQMKRHEQEHSGVRKFPCQFCSKAFYTNSERRRHLLYHFKSKRFQCELCNKKYYEAGHLKIHMQSHDNYKPFKCEMCTGAFFTNYKLKRHMLNHRKRVNRDENKKDKNKSDSIVEPKFTKLCSVQVNNDDTDYLTNLIANVSEDKCDESEEESYLILHGDDIEGNESIVGSDDEDEDTVYYVLDNNSEFVEESQLIK